MVFGYDDKIELFKKLIEKDDLAHAYLFYGEPEIGKATFARFLAATLESVSPEDKNTLLIDAMFVRSEEGSTIGIDDVLKMQEFLYKRPFSSKRRTVVVENAENLTREAEGALLKIVEEPPEHSLLIFVAPDRRDLFDALLSRVEEIYFPTLSPQEIAEGLMKFAGVGEEKARKIARASFGRFGRAVAAGEGKKEEESVGEEDLEKELSSDILKLWSGGVVKNRKLLSWLLGREMSIRRYKRYNLNMKLQKKAVRSVLSEIEHGETS